MARLLLATLIALSCRLVAPTLFDTPTNDRIARHAQEFPAILINCGGVAHTDTQGRQWSADRFFTGGAVYGTKDNILDTLDDSLYNSERYNQSTYNIAVPAGVYRVVLHFAEIYHTRVNARVFRVNVEGQLIPDIDIVKSTGVARKPLVRQVPLVEVRDGSLTIKFQNHVPPIDVPKVSAIEVHQVGLLSPTVNVPVASPVPNLGFLPVLINSGGRAFVDSQNRSWRADTLFTGGAIHGTNARIAETVDQQLYNSERYNQSTYNIAVPPGSYTVVLHHAEIYHTTLNSRVFDVDVEGQLLMDMDLVRYGGGVAFKALTKQVSPVDVRDGFLTVQFKTARPQIDVPTISGIEVHRFQPGQPIPVPIVPVQAPVLAPSNAAPNLGFAFLINCGGLAFTDSQNRMWRADTFFTGGLVSGTKDTILDTVDQQLYNSERYGPMTYSVAVPRGSFRVVLHLSEIYHTTAGSRVFDVDVEGKRLDDIDIVQFGGGVARKALTRQVSAVDVVDGFITIQFMNNVPQIDLPKISAIEIHQMGPVEAPSAPTPKAPAATPTVQFSTILINSGGKAYTDTQGRLWSEDMYFTGGNSYFNNANNILATADDTIFHGERWGEFKYEVPIGNGDYELILHLAEIFFTTEGSRVFDVVVEGKMISDIDIVQQAGQAFRAIQRETPVTVLDGFLTIEFLENVPSVDNPKVSGIEIKRIGNHYAHAVTGGPYAAVDADGDGFGLIDVVASESHTHGPGQVLTNFTWRLGAAVVGSGEITSLSLPVGTHDLTLTVRDSSGDTNIDVTTAVVNPQGFPQVFSLSPVSGDVAGGTIITLTGRSFSSVTEVRFGLVILRGSEVNVLNSTTIIVLTPAAAFGVPVSVSVVTSVGESNKQTFTYVNSSPIAFTIAKVLDMSNPTAVAFGPDGKLYVGTTTGRLGRFTLNDSYDTVVSSMVANLGADRGIHGIAFDPMETAELGSRINCYVATADIFHGEFRNSFGNAINGKIQSVSGANLDKVIDIVSNLPVSELDHSLNAIYFGDNGELYIGVGSNTNGGIPGELSGSRLMRENFFSGAVLVAHLGKPSFNGFITYNADIDGDPVTGHGPNGVEVFGSGLRNPFGVLLHSNGKVYATENGPNPGYGDMATGCGEGQQIPDVYERDELNLVTKGSYYGHPNHKRGQTDPRQCIWRGASLPPGTVDGYTAPMMKLTSSTNGMVEFESDHFNGQMRGDLILSKYTDGLFRVILSSDGESVSPFSDPALSLGGDNGLAVTQAPDGSLIDARYSENSCYIFKPNEAASSKLDIKTVFPRRGGLAGGSKLSIFGVNFSGTPVVTVGGQACANVVVVRSTKLECILPGGTVGAKDVVVTIGTVTDTFVKGYRYITGTPVS